MQIGESLVISIFEHVMSLKTIFHVISKHSQQTTWPYQTLEATSESRTPYIFTYQSHNSNRSPKFQTAITPLTSLILLVEPGRKQMSRYFGLAKQSHLIIVKVQRLVYLSHRKSIWAAWRDVTSDCPFAPIVCLSNFYFKLTTPNRLITLVQK